MKELVELMLLMPCKVSDTAPELCNPLGFFTRTPGGARGVLRITPQRYFLRFGAITMII